MSPRALALLLVLSFDAHAQEALFASPIFGVGGNALDVAGGDLDGDGDADLVAVLDNVTLTVSLSDGGVMLTPVTYNGTSGLQRLTLADTDLDGDLDVVGAADGPLTEVAYIRRGNGDGTLFNPQFLVVSPGPKDVAVADLDQDGDPDLAVACQEGVRISLLFGFGDGTFEPKIDIEAGGSPLGIEAGFVDGGDAIDLMAATSLTTFSLLLGDGRSGFAAPLPVPVGLGGSDLALGDVDQDGDADLAVTFLSAAVGTALSQGDGSFGALALVPVTGSSRRPSMADFDEDGHLDVTWLTDNGANAFAGVLLSQGDGSFDPPRLLAAPLGAKGLSAADYTGDGDLDLVSAGFAPFAGDMSLMLRGRGDGDFGDFLYGGDGASDVDAADFDGDGFDELVVLAPFADRLAVHRGLGFGGFSAAPEILAVGDSPPDFSIGDVFEDGHLDLVVARQSPNVVSTLIGDGTLGFAAPFDLALPSSPRSLELLDADVDGHLDVAVLLADATLRVWLGDGAAGWTASDIESTAAINPGGLDAGDLDGDGLLDLVAGNSGQSVVHVYFGNGTGDFDPPLTYPTLAGNTNELLLGDLDQDGDLDLAQTSDFGPSTSVLFNDGAGVLGAPVAFNAGFSGPHGVAIADLTGDGLADLAVTTESGPTFSDVGVVTIWPGTGGGAFGPLTTAKVTGLPQGLLARDLDGDGALDLAVATLRDHLCLLFNTGGPWDELGFPLAGAQGLPRQWGAGTLQPVAPFAFRLSDALPAGLTAHVVGLCAIHAPFKGGVFVPAPLVINYPLPLDADGEVLLEGPWPGPAAPGVELYFQFWTADPAGVKGFSASGALRGTLP